MKALGYFRTSPDISNTEHGIQSPSEEQEEGFYRFCQEHDYEPTATFTDIDSANRVNETQYQNMLGYIHKQPENYTVAVKSLQYLHPDPQETVRCLLELDSLGVKVDLIDEPSTDLLSEAIQLWSDRRQDKGSGERVREAMRIRAIYGQGMGKPPFGYRIGDNHKLEIVADEAEIVTLIYQLYLQENMGIRRIAGHLNENGITTKKGNHWSIVGIRDILRNRTYLGTYSRFGVKVPGSHPSIIPASAFDRVQERLSSKTKRGNYARKPPLLLAGLAYCGYCGNRMIGVNRSQTWTRHKDRGETTGEYHYYQCQSRANQSICQYHSRRAEDLENTVLVAIQKLTKPEAQEQWINQNITDTEQIRAEQKELVKKLAILNRKFRRYLDQAAQDTITIEELRFTGEELLRERHFLKQRLTLLEAEERGELTAEQRKRNILKAVDNIQERWEFMTIAMKRSLLQYVIDRIIVYDDYVEPLFRP